VSFFEVFLLVLLEKNFSERRRKILGGKNTQRERETKKEEKRRRPSFLRFSFFALFSSSFPCCARASKKDTHTHTQTFTQI
tara:strand:- start:200 stop:442 length:243 start_codon:yes stop_codon:yes gene_type:complete